MNGISRSSGSSPLESSHVNEPKTSTKDNKISGLFSKKIKSLFRIGKDIKSNKIIKASSEKTNQSELNKLTKETFGTTINFKSDNLIDAIKTNILDKIGYSEKGHFKNIENIKDLLETEGGLDAVVSLLKGQVEAFKIQGEAVGVFGILKVRTNAA